MTNDRTGFPASGSVPGATRGPGAAPPTRASNAIAWDTDEHGILHVVFDRPGERANLLSSDVLRALEHAIEEAAGRSSELRGVLLRSGKPGMFIAGADVEEIASIDDTYKAAEAARFGQAVFHKIANLSIPTAAAIHGPCMGGGTEMALACTFRLAADDRAVSIGLPETQIGIIPGFGGTQRLPRLVGLERALDLILTGRRLDAKRARKVGLVDVVAPAEYLEREAVALLLRASDKGVAATVAAIRKPLPARSKVLSWDPLRRFVMAQARKKTAAKVSPENYPAPFRALEAIDAAYRMDLTPGLDYEARIIGELIPTPTAKSLIWLFKNNTAVKKGDGGIPAVPRKVSRAAVLGAGIMGGGISRLLADREIPVRLRDIRYGALMDALTTAGDVWQRKVRRRRMTPRERASKMAFIAPTLDLTGMARVDVVIEAVVEDLEIKKKVLAEIEPVLPERAVFASNTSSIPIGRIAEGAVRPERVVGMHFFNPVHRMPLVEIIAGPRSSPEAVATVRSLAIRTGKTPIVVQDRPGFLVNRILMFYMAEALQLLEAGVRIDAVDEAMRGFGMPMGPFELLDQVGIDTARHVSGVLHAAFGERVDGPSRVLDAMVEAGRLGVKAATPPAGEGGTVSSAGDGRGASAGFYRYRDGKKTAVASDTYRICGVGTSSSLPAETVQERLVLAMVNEAALCLEEGVVRTSREVDLAMVLGTGFPPFRGGLLHHADRVGVPVVADRLNRLAEAHGERYRPADLLRRMVREERRFHA